MAAPDVVNYSFFSPMRTIAAISNGFPALVTTAVANPYMTGQIIRLDVPLSFGMVQLSNLDPDQRKAPIVVVNSTQFTIPIDTTNFAPFVIPPDQDYPVGPAAQAQYAQAVPVGEITSTLLAATQNILKGGSLPNPTNME